MQASLEQESARLARSWMRHEAGWLRDYLVGGVEDPRLNVQSILSRHFLLEAATGDRFAALMEAEYRFAAVMNWLVRLAEQAGTADELEAVLHALRLGSDNAEGTEIPGFVGHGFAALPVAAGESIVPNYIQAFLAGTRFSNGRAELPTPSLMTFQELWSAALCPSSARSKLSVLEPACGSANDYRFLRAYGLAALVDYTGFDLCAKNVANAHALFPEARFEFGNVFEIAAPDRSFDLCFVHDLFEHLSLEGLQTAVKEICRVTRRGICVGFFNMDEAPEHTLQPVDEYHWNILSLARMRESFAEQGFAGHAIHIGSFLRQRVGCEQTHNPRAYTFTLRAVDKAEHKHG